MRERPSVVASLPLDSPRAGHPLTESTGLACAIRLPFIADVRMASERISPSTLSRPSLRAKVVLLCVSLIVGGLITEGAVRAMEYLQQSRPAKTAGPSERPRRYYLPEGSTTSRGNPNPEKYDSASFRIAVVGDSFTFAPHMQPDDAFTARLERLLNLNDYSIDAPAMRAAVVNLGRPGFSTIHEVATVRSALAKKPSLVLLETTLNDAQLRPLTKEPPEVQGQFGPYRPTGFIRSVTSRWRTLNLVLSRIHNTQSVQSYIAYHHHLFSHPPSRDSGGFKSEVRHGKPLKAFYIRGIFGACY